MDVNSIRKDFPMLNKKANGRELVYFDNAATTFKPTQVIEAEMEYYTSYCANTHRGDYDIAYIADSKYDEARNIVAKFINAKSKEVAFTSGDSMSLNQIAFGMTHLLKEDDEILITVIEHASNVLPWYRVSKITGCKIKFIPLDEEGNVTEENLLKVITEKTKVVSIAHVSNVLGNVNDVKTLAKVCHKYGAWLVVDGAQSVPHMKIDVKDLDIDFLTFSGHKCYGPTGIGVLYGKYHLLEQLDPYQLGGGMNASFDTGCNVKYLSAPTKFEAGTQNIAGAIGLARALQYLDEIGMDNIYSYEYELKKYFVEKLKELDTISIYNENTPTGIVSFNIKDVFAQDAASLFNKYGICVRSGEHCAKLIHNHLGVDQTIRASVCFYNTKEEIDYFIEICKKGGDFLDAFFD